MICVHRQSTSSWSVRAAALFTGLMGIVNVLSVTTPALHDRLTLLREWLPLEIRFGSHLAATLSGFALLLLASSLARRKRTAWSLTVTILVLSAFSHLLKGLDYEEALLSLGLAAWLAHLRPLFHALSDRPSVRNALRVCGLAVAFTLAYGILGLDLLDRHFRVHFDLPEAARQVAILFTQFDDSGVMPVTRFGHYFAESIYIVAAATMGYGLLALVRPVLVRAPATPAERERARMIVEDCGQSSLAWFTLGSDKSYWFSPGGSMVSFVVRRRVCLALGDPIGPLPDRAGALAGFLEFCARNDWHPAFVGAEPELLSLYRQAGLEALCVGHEAIIPLTEFTLAGGRNKDIRGRVARLTNLGYTTQLHEPPLCPDFVAELASVSDEWLEAVGAVEQSFSQGAFESDYIGGSPVMAVHAPNGSVCAFANFYPEFQRNEATVDLLRRRRTVENGTMEFLCVALFEWSKVSGCETFNLGLSPLAGVGGDADDPAAEKALRYLFDHSSRLYNFKGLYGFKAKFHPDWSPRFLIYPGAAGLLPVTVAVIQAHSGDGFLWKMLGAQRPPFRRRQRRARATPRSTATAESVATL